MQNSNTIKKSALAPTILIAGGAGFIGSHLAEVLLQKEARVIVLDNFRTGKEIHVNHLLSDPKFALYDVNINEGLPTDIESVDYILHLAGLEEYLYSKSDIDLDSLLTNALGTKNLLDFAQRSDAKFLLASTIDVYEGKMSQLNLESYFGKTNSEESKYSMSEAKRYAEALVWEYHKKNNTNVRIVRLPEVYGPRMSLDSSGNLGKILKDLMEGRPFLINGSGIKKEFYLYIQDAVSGMIKALLNENTSGNIYSLVPKEPISILETAYLVRSLADRRVEIKFENDFEMENARIFTPDTYSLLYLKWDPKVSFKDGIISTLNWFGYPVNENAFKHAKLIDQNAKKKSNGIFKQLTKNEPDKLEQIWKNVQQPQQTSSEFQTKEIQHARDEYNSRKISNVKEIPKIKKVRKLPQLNFKFSLPKVTFPKFKNPAKEIKRHESRTLSSKVSLASKISVFLVVACSFIAVFVILPAYKTYSSVKLAMAELEAVPELISQFDSSMASEKADAAYKNFTKANKFYSSLDWLYKLGGKYEEHRALSKLLKSMTYFSRVAYDLSLTSEPVSDIWESLKPESTRKFDPKDLDVSKLHISDARSNLQLAQADFNEVNTQQLPQYVKENLSQYSDVLKITENGLELASTVISDLPNLLGFGEPKKYVILFQNNNELRPTGGFIGSYAFLYLRDGKIDDLSIDDIYNPDGQLDVRNIRVVPPKPIGDFLAEDRLYIRNANWNPDFPKSAETIRDLFYKLNGEEIDGMITVDLNLAAGLLKVTGPLFLTAYNEEVSADNLYERTQFHSSYAYEDGSQQKRQFLTILGSKLLEALFALDKSKTQDLAATVSEAMNQRHLQIQLFSSTLNALLMEKGWNGGLERTDGDYLQVVNANLGGTKANYYVKQDMAYRISSKTRDGLLRAELVLTYNHTGADESWPGGPYTDYLRVLTQAGAKLTGAKLIRDLTIEEDIFDDIVISTVDPYNSFETSFKLEPQSSVKVILYYDLPQSLSLTKSMTDYNLVWQKQAGTNDDSFAYSLSVPFGMYFVNGSPTLKTAEGTIFTSGKLNNDLKLFVKLE